jgi:hypothetical protein
MLPLPFRVYAVTCEGHRMHCIACNSRANVKHAMTTQHKQLSCKCLKRGAFGSL